MKKLTYQEIQERFASKGHTLLTPQEDYKNTHQKLKFICGNCGETSKMSAHSCIDNKGYCIKCKTQTAGKSQRHTLEYVKEYFNTQGCTLLEIVYKNSRTPMKFICSCSNIGFVDFHDFQTGKRCLHCLKDRIKITCEKKYGGIGYASKELAKKSRQTNLEINGSETYNNIEMIKETSAKNQSFNSFYSKISQEIFWKVFKKLPKNLHEHTHFAEYNKEYCIYTNKRLYTYDLVVSSLKKCVEYNGCAWHGHPSMNEDETNWQPFRPELTVGEQREFDRVKIQALLDERGYETLVVWDFEENPVDRIIKFLNI